MNFSGHKKPGLAEQRAVRSMFFLGGFASASWAPLVPYLKARLSVGEDVLGMLLLCVGIGSLLTMPLSGLAAEKFGCRKVLTCASITMAGILLGLATMDTMALSVILLLAYGAMLGCLDVVMNISAVIVEQAAGKRIMSGLHGFWSVGGFVGAGAFGLWVSRLGLSPLASTVIASFVCCAIIAIANRWLLPYGGGGGSRFIAIPRGIVTFIGIIAGIAFLMEGAIMDWGGVFLTSVRNLDMSRAGTGFAIFSAAMLIMRLTGDRITNRLGAKRVVIGGSLLAFLGFLSLIYLPGLLPVYAGFFAIGVGCANVVPVFYSLIGRPEDMPISTAVPAVSTLGYAGVLMGPAAVGFLAHATSLSASFLFLAALLLIQIAIALHVYRTIKI